MKKQILAILTILLFLTISGKSLLAEKIETNNDDSFVNVKDKKDISKRKVCSSSKDGDDETISSLDSSNIKTGHYYKKVYFFGVYDFCLKRNDEGRRVGAFDYTFYYKIHFDENGIPFDTTTHGPAHHCGLRTSLIDFPSINFLATVGMSPIIMATYLG